jgi:hypothetical protein
MSPRIRPPLSHHLRHPSANNTLYRYKVWSLWIHNPDCLLTATAMLCKRKQMALCYTQTREQMENGRIPSNRDSYKTDIWRSNWEFLFENYECHAVLLHRARGNRHLKIELERCLIENYGCHAVLLQRARGNRHLEIKLRGFVWELRMSSVLL